MQQIADLLDVPPARLLSGDLAAAPPVASVSAGDWRSFDGIAIDSVLEAATWPVRRGFHASGMREVAAEAALSVAGVYHHYRSKEQILVALLDVTMAEIGWRLEAARAEGRTPVESFALMVEALALFHAVRGDLAFLGASEMRGITGTDRERVVGLRNDVQYASTVRPRCASPKGRSMSMICIPRAGRSPRCARRCRPGSGSTDR